MKFDRQTEMLSYIREKKTVRNSELLKKFGISIQTLRRDINKFETQGLIRKVYGGVIYNDRFESVKSVDSLTTRNALLNDEKERVGKLAAKLVGDGDVIFVDSGTTAYRILHYLSEAKDVTVISHCLDVMVILRDMHNLTGICAGGILQHDMGSFIIDSSFYPYNYSKAFISTVGISLEKNLTNTNLHEGAMKAQAIAQSASAYIVADHGKFDVVAYNQFADFSKITGVITDRCPSENYVRFFESNNIKLIY